MPNDLISHLEAAAAADAKRTRGEWAQGELPRLVHHRPNADYVSACTRLDFAALAARLRALEAVEAVVAKLPKTADGVPVRLHSIVWTRYGAPDYPPKPFHVVSIMYRGTVELTLVANIDGDWSDQFDAEAFDCYSTEAAALAALAPQQPTPASPT